MGKRNTGKQGPVTEQQVIEMVAQLTPTGDQRVLTGIGDDAAVLAGDPSGTGLKLNQRNQVVTTDLLIEGTHFSLNYMSLADIGYKSLAVNVSDIASMGARPTFAFGNLGIPPRASRDEFEELLSGIGAVLAENGVELTGGDTVAAPQWVIGFTLLGDVQGPGLLRSTARPGDGIWHSGEVGLSQAGLHLLWGGEAPGPKGDPGLTAAVARHRRPLARTGLGQWLYENRLATSCIDLSDSLSQCLIQLAAASNVGLYLDFQSYRFPAAVDSFISKRRRAPTRGVNAFNIPQKMQPSGSPGQYDSKTAFLLSASEDYELLFTAPPQASIRLLREAPVPVTRIGTVVAVEEGYHYAAEDGRTLELAPSGFSHR